VGWRRPTSEVRVLGFFRGGDEWESSGRGRVEVVSQVPVLAGAAGRWG
jgi:hypothetical protein